jgi:hypothetical protein
MSGFTFVIPGAMSALILIGSRIRAHRRVVRTSSCTA